LTGLPQGGNNSTFEPWTHATSKVADTADPRQPDRPNRDYFPRLRLWLLVHDRAHPPAAPSSQMRRHGHQPLVDPGWKHAVFVATGSSGTPRSGRHWRARRAPPTDPSITHSGRSSTSADSASMRTNTSRSEATSTDPSGSPSQVLDHPRRNAVVGLSLTSVQRWVLSARIHQVKQS